MGLDPARCGCGCVGGRGVFCFWRLLQLDDRLFRAQRQRDTQPCSRLPTLLYGHGHLTTSPNPLCLPHSAQFWFFSKLLPLRRIRIGFSTPPQPRSSHCSCTTHALTTCLVKQPCPGPVSARSRAESAMDTDALRKRAGIRSGSVGMPKPAALESALDTDALRKRASRQSAPVGLPNPLSVRVPTTSSLSKPASLPEVVLLPLSRWSW